MIPIVLNNTHDAVHLTLKAAVKEKPVEAVGDILGFFSFPSLSRVG
jgi:hypothetical protein